MASTDRNPNVALERIGKKATVIFLDNLEKLGFEYATNSGTSICIDDMHIPKKKNVMIRGAEREVLDVQKQYSEGLITNGERYNKVIDIWAQVTENIADEMMKELGAEGLESVEKITEDPELSNFATKQSSFP